MADPKKPAPEIMPPAPDVEPEQRPEEIPQDKDAPEKRAPEMDGADIMRARSENDSPHERWLP
jgi:hypothetical protein